MSNTNYPGAIDSPYDPTTTDTLATANHHTLHGLVNDAIVAAETKLGIGSSNQTPAANQLLLGNGAGTTAWGPITPAYATGSTTGTGNFALSASPTFTGTLVAAALGVSGNATLASLILNGSLTGTGLASQVQSYSNGGTAGGTGYYINLGGIKLCWGITASQSSHNGPPYGINWPASFFTTVQSIILSIANLGIDITQTVANASGNNATAITAYFDSITNSVGATMVVCWFVIGT